MSSVIQAKQLTKHYGHINALQDLDFEIKTGSIVGLVGPNGAGKSTLLKACLGLVNYTGDLTVLGHNPAKSRIKIMQESAYVADIAILPRWMTLKQLIDDLSQTHPHYNKERTLDFVRHRGLPVTEPLKHFSKGMLTKAHLALILGIEAKLLILDEPTLGLDIPTRQQYYQYLYSQKTEDQTIIISTHQIEEISPCLTHLMLLDHSRLLRIDTIRALQNEVVTLIVEEDKLPEAQKHHPIFTYQAGASYIVVYKKAPEVSLDTLGRRQPTRLSDIVLAYLEAPA